MTAATLPQVLNAGGSNVPSEGSLLIDSSGAEKGTVANPLVMAPPSLSAQAWPDGTVAMDLRGYAGIEIQITAYTAAVSFTRSFDGTTYTAVNVTDASYNSATTATATGFFTVKGGGYLKWTGTATVLVRGYN